MVRSDRLFRCDGEKSKPKTTTVGFASFAGPNGPTRNAQFLTTIRPALLRRQFDGDFLLLLGQRGLVQSNAIEESAKAPFSGREQRSHIKCYPARVLPEQSKPK